MKVNPSTPNHLHIQTDKYLVKKWKPTCLTLHSFKVIKATQETTRKNNPLLDKQYLKVVMKPLQLVTITWNILQPADSPSNKSAHMGNYTCMQTCTIWNLPRTTGIYSIQISRQLSHHGFSFFTPASLEIKLWRVMWCDHLTW